MHRHPVLRRLGIGFLGFVGGVLLAIILQDVLASAFVAGRSVPAALAVTFVYLLPGLGAAGIVVALMIDHHRKATDPGRHDALP